MATIARRLKEALSTGQVPDNLKLLYDFQLYLAAKRIMELPKEERTKTLETLPQHTHKRIREHAIITKRYFTERSKTTRV